jgi:hypothetical protein
MVYRFNDLKITDPTFTFSLGNVADDFVTVNCLITFNNGEIEWMVGAKPLLDDLQTWGEIEISKYIL